jgi:phosphohistidine swiveling domain-containing protein
VARELGIPDVIGTDDGTRVVRDGDRIRLDGSACTVTILERSPAAPTQ